MSSNRANSTPDSDTVTITGGDGTPNTVTQLRDEETLEVDTVVVSYSAEGSTNSSVEIYDEEDGTNSNDLNDKVITLNVAPGDTVALTEVTLRHIEDDIIALGDGSNDADIDVTVGGVPITG